MAQLAFAGRQTIALWSDGGCTILGLGDLPTQVQHKAPCIQIIFTRPQEAGNAGASLPHPSGISFKNQNFAKVVKTMGTKGTRLEKSSDVRAALSGALGRASGAMP